MPKRIQLTSEQYTAGSKKLTADDLELYQQQIVPSALALALLSKRAGRELNRSIIPQLCRHGKLHPMGTFHNSLYFWRTDIASVPLHTRKSEVMQSDEKNA